MTEGKTDPRIFAALDRIVADDTIVKLNNEPTTAYFADFSNNRHRHELRVGTGSGYNFSGDPREMTVTESEGCTLITNANGDTLEIPS